MSTASPSPNDDAHTYEIDDPEYLTEEIIKAVSEATGVDPVPSENPSHSESDATRALEPLYNVIDTDALESLFQPQTQGKVHFTYSGCSVEVTSDGYVRVWNESNL